jgi:hypothetical protein
MSRRLIEWHAMLIAANAHPKPREVGLEKLLIHHLQLISGINPESSRYEWRIAVVIVLRVNFWS